MRPMLALCLTVLAFALVVASLALSLATALLLCRNGAPALTALGVLTLGMVGALLAASAGGHFATVARKRY